MWQSSKQPFHANAFLHGHLRRQGNYSEGTDKVLLYILKKNKRAVIIFPNVMRPLASRIS